jgi:serine protease AprX
MKMLRKSVLLILLVTILANLIGPAENPLPALSARLHPQLALAAGENPDEQVAIIIQSAPGAGIEGLVHSLGGTISKRLPMIHAVAARVPAAGTLQLSRSPLVRWISPDARVVRSLLEEWTARDEFNVTDYNNNDGSASWKTSWIETGDDGSPFIGWITIESDSYCPVSSSTCLEIEGRAGEDAAIQRGLNLGQAVSAVLTYEYHYDGVAYLQHVLEVSTDGGLSWSELKRYAASGLGTESLDLGGHLSADTRLRFRVETQYMPDVPSTAYLRVDNFQVAFQAESSDPSRPTNNFLVTTGAANLHSEGLDGSGVAIAVVDSGIASHPDLAGRQIDGPGGGEDDYGHGTHVAGLIAGDGSASAGAYMGMAPGATIIDLDVSDSEGMAYESDVVAALQWIFENKDLYNIRVANLSLNSTMESSYMESPLDAAVEILWFNGVVVVASVGNTGKGGAYNTARTAPANDPFIIAVGASDENSTPGTGDDTLTAFTAQGPTLDGFVKPDLIAPGYAILSALSPASSWGTEFPERVVDGSYIRLNGTSMAAPLVSGAVALLLQDEPDLTPDQVKFRLLDTASSIQSEAGASPYLNAYAAVHGTSTDAANTNQAASSLLWTGEEGVAWDSVAWNSVAWNSVAWNSVAWEQVEWGEVELDGIYWENELQLVFLPLILR